MPTQEKIDSWYTPRWPQGSVSAEEEKELTYQKQHEDAEQADMSFAVEDEF